MAMTSPTQQQRNTFFIFPPEIRRMIYEHVFEPRPLARTAQRRFSQYTIDTSILLVNSKIYHEANDAMCKINRFIVITTDVPDEILKLLENHTVRVLCAELDKARPWRRRIRNFKHFVMRIKMVKHGLARDSHHSFFRIMLCAGEMHSNFIRSIRYIDYYIPQTLRWVDLSFQVEIVALFENTTFIEHITPKLLDPILEFWKGSLNFDLIGSIGTDKGYELQTLVRQPDTGDWTEVLGRADYARARGLASFAKGEWEDAWQEWHKGLNVLKLAETSHQAWLYHNVGGEEWIRGADTSTFRFLHGCVLAVQMLVEEEDNRRKRKHWAAEVVRKFQSSFDVIKDLESDPAGWQPDEHHKAELQEKCARSMLVLGIYEVEKLFNFRVLNKACAIRANSSLRSTSLRIFVESMKFFRAATKLMQRALGFLPNDVALASTQSDIAGLIGLYRIFASNLMVGTGS